MASTDSTPIHANMNLSTSTLASCPSQEENKNDNTKKIQQLDTVFSISSTLATKDTEKKQKREKQQGTNNKVSRNQQKKIEKATVALQQQNAAFDRFYSNYYGEDRWYKYLKPSLMQKGKHVALVNRRTDWDTCKQVLDITNTTMTRKGMSEKVEEDTPTSSSPMSSAPYLSNFFPNIYIRLSTLQQQNQLSTNIGLETHPHDPTEKVKDVHMVQPDDISPVSFNLNLDSEDELLNNDDLSSKIPSRFDDDDSLVSDTADYLNPLTRVDHDSSTIDSIPWPSPSLPTSLDPSGLCVYYPLDYASIFPIVLLDIKPCHHVLDLCAAPGGKSLAIAQVLKLSLKDPGDHFTSSTKHSTNSSSTSAATTTPVFNPKEDLGYLECNDISPDRRLRLVKVLKHYLPPSCLIRTHVTLGDATKYHFVSRFGLERKFDRILVDAPCSSERHLLQELRSAQTRTGVKNIHRIPEYAKEYMSWTVNRSKTNAERQLLLLWNALHLCLDGGKVVYSTCALSELENDGLIEKILQKVQRRNEKNKPEKDDNDSLLTTSFDVIVLPMDETMMPFGEKTKYGWQILPDNNPLGWGPIFCAVLQKNVNV